MKSLKLILIGLVVAHSATAQLAQDFKLGLKTGINYNEIKGRNFKSSVNSDWHFGAFMQIRGKKWGLGVEGIYDRGKYELRDLIVDASLAGFLGDTSTNGPRFQAHKFQVPIYLMYKFSVFQLQLGGVYEGNLRFNDKENFLSDSKDIFKKKYHSIMGGLWVDVTKRISIGARYQMGLYKINSDEIDQQWRTRETQLHIGYSFL